MTTTLLVFQVEFTIEIPRGSNSTIETSIRETLQNVKIIELDTRSGRLVVESVEPWPRLLSQIESTGLRAALTGFGGSAAVSIVGSQSVQGVIRFTSPDPETKKLVMDGVIDGLDPEKEFQIGVHECGDLSEGCASVGDIYGRRMASTKADSNGRLSFRCIDDQFAISDLIGRSVVVASTSEEEKR